MDQQGNKILIINGFSDNLYQIYNLLSQEGYQVQTATAEIEKVKLFHPDLILLALDINQTIEEFDGYELCQRLQEKEETRDVPVIFISNVLDVSFKLKAFELGAVDYITSPFAPLELLARVKNQLKIYHRQKQIITSNITQQIEEREDLFEVLANNTMILIWMSDSGGGCTFFNQSWLSFTGRTLEQEIGNGWLKGVHPQDQQLCISTYKTAFVKRQPFEMEYRLRRFDGVYRWFIDSGKPRFSSEGRFLGYTGFCLDISDRKETEVFLQQALSAAEAANHAKSSFLASMTHELRTPLNSILGFSQILMQDRTLTQKQLEHIEIINRNGQHLLTLINDILSMSQIESGQKVLQEQNVNLANLISSIQEHIQIKANKKGLNFILESASVLPQYIQTDEMKLRQVLIHLLKNAVKYTNKGNVILRVRKNKSDTRLIFEVEDTGCGIAPEEINSLFKPFIQTASGCKSKEGTGLGLAISHKFIELIGGEITVNSKIGIGSVFQVDIPLKVITEELSNNDVFKITSSAIKPLTKEDLAVMPSNWIQQLHLAAMKIDDREVLELIKQIPATETDLISNLTELVNNFRLDLVIELTKV